MEFNILKNAYHSVNNKVHFYSMCNQFLSFTMSKFVKLQSILKDSKD